MGKSVEESYSMKLGNDCSSEVMSLERRSSDQSFTTPKGLPYEGTGRIHNSEQVNNGDDQAVHYDRSARRTQSESSGASTNDSTSDRSGCHGDDSLKNTHDEAAWYVY